MYDNITAQHQVLLVVLVSTLRGRNARCFVKRISIGFHVHRTGTEHRFLEPRDGVREKSSFCLLYINKKLVQRINKPTNQNISYFNRTAFFRSRPNYELNFTFFSQSCFYFQNKKKNYVVRGFYHGEPVRSRLGSKPVRFDP